MAPGEAHPCSHFIPVPFQGFLGDPGPAGDKGEKGVKVRVAVPAPHSPARVGRALSFPAPGPALLHHSGCSWLFQGVKGENGLPGPAGLQVSHLESWRCPHPSLHPLLLTLVPLCDVPKLQPTLSCLSQSLCGLCGVPAPPGGRGQRQCHLRVLTPHCWLLSQGLAGLKGAMGLQGPAGPEVSAVPLSVPPKGLQELGIPLGRGV